MLSRRERADAAIKLEGLDRHRQGARASEGKVEPQSAKSSTREIISERFCQGVKQDDWGRGPLASSKRAKGMQRWGFSTRGDDFFSELLFANEGDSPNHVGGIDETLATSTFLSPGGSPGNSPTCGKAPIHLSQTLERAGALTSSMASPLVGTAETARLARGKRWQLGRR